MGGLPTSTTGNANFAIVVSKALGGTPAILVAGLSFQSWMGVPLPLALGPFGLSGCSLLVSGDVFLPTITSGAGAGAGVGVVSLPVPMNPSLAGGLLHLQGYVVDPGPGLLPGAMSRAVQLLIL